MASRKKRVPSGRKAAAPAKPAAPNASPPAAGVRGAAATRKRAAPRAAAPREPQAETPQEMPAETPRKPAAVPVVGLGASAGGFESFQKFFTHMPARSGMAFVVVQHLDPRHETLLPELLGKLTKMPVAQVRDQTPVEPDHVYVIPANATLTLEQGLLRVQSPAAERHGFPIDRLFQSLATDQGRNAVCILFSGAGTDGTLGLRAVKEHGGMTMAQTPDSALHDSMVQSAIATGMVDQVLEPERMPEKLVEYARFLATAGDHTAPALAEEATAEVRRICELVRRKTGHDFSGYKRTTLVRRIQRRMQVHQMTQVGAYIERLRKDAKEVELLFRDLLIGVTHFFRDPEAFEALAREVIAAIAAQAQDTVRIWAPGCASGEEAYSVAILVREALDRREVNPKVQIFAGDIDDESLELARLGRYPDSIAQNVSAARLQRFFDKQGHTYQVKKAIREMCVFSRHNLIRDPPFSRLDLIVCRNLLIYLEPALQKQVAGYFHYALRPGGYLFLGPSENLNGPADAFRTIDKKHRLFQRTETLVRPTVLLARGEDGGVLRPTFTVDSAGATHRGPGGMLQSLEKVLLEEYAPAWVVVNRNGEAIHYSPRTGRYLETPPGAPSADLLAHARRGLRAPLRTALHVAVATGETHVQPNVQVAFNGDVHHLDIVVRPVAEAGQAPNLFMVVFREISRSTAAPDAATKAAAADGETQHLEAELRRTKEHLQSTIEEVETSNEELKSANEELQSANEELQSTNEELQTSKEELQSVNEELETINVELGKKVDELDAAHSDLQNLFQSTRIPTLFLDRNLRIKKFTEAATDLFKLIPTDVGRPITDIVARVAGAELMHDVREVLKTLTPRERKVRLADGDGSYVTRVLPYRRLDGVVITFTDVSDIDRAMARSERLAAIVDASQDAIVGRDLEGTITVWNRGAEALFGYTQAEAVGKPLAFLLPPELRDEQRDVFRKVVRGEEVPVFETVRLTKRGERIPVLASLALVTDEAGRPTAVSTTLRDIREIVVAREAMRSEGQRKDEFLAMLSHELRNPLAPLRTALEIARDAASSPAQVEQSLDVMARQLARVTAIVDQLLDASRVSTQRLVLRTRLLDLDVLLRECADDYRQTLDSAGLALEVAAPGEPVWVEGDANRLSQVLANGLDNAVKFTQRGGKVKLALAVAPEGATVSISDDGDGMDGDSLKRLFAPEGSARFDPARRRGGLGLGLWLAKALVEAHHGALEVASDGPGRGFELRFRLPVWPGAPEGHPSWRPGDQPDEVEARAKKILVVDDDPDGVEMMRVLLEMEGHEVEVAFDGPEALSRARDFRPDVIVCDIGLPGSLDGYGVARALRADPKTRGARLVALTGSGRDEDRRRAFDAGFDRHITKPADPDTLRRLLAGSPAP